METQTKQTIEERVTSRQNAVKYLTNQVTEGMPADVAGIVRDLKRKGLDDYEMGRFANDLFNATWPTIQRNIEGYKKEYELNPELAKGFSKEYRLVDFIPLLGIFPHERRANKLRESQRFFYMWANESALNKLKNFAFNAYHWIVPSAIMMYGFMQLGDK